MRFGILAHSSEGAALCFLTFCPRGLSRAGPAYAPGRRCSTAQRWGMSCRLGTRAIMRRFAHSWRSRSSGLRPAVATSSRAPTIPRTSHSSFRAPDLALPGLQHCGRRRASEAAALGMTQEPRCLGRASPWRDRSIAAPCPRSGFEPCFPDDEERADIDRIIFDELVEGQFRTRRGSRYVEIIERLEADEGCDGVALVCTEIPLLVTPDVSPLPTLDFTRLLARAAFEVATGNRPVPEWRGGPID